jgi:divalent metal cation (Fe/Co/Zn/Cd) transporter
LNFRKYETSLIIAGIIMILAGVIFTLQSNSAIGPSSSFMYNNPEWTNNGLIIIIIGAILVIVGLTILQIKKRN